jgi:glycosyltransferase involved in cell wall biosynthesis
MARLSAELSKIGYRVYRIGRQAESFPPPFGRPISALCRSIVHFLQKACDAALVLFIHPEMGYNPVKQRLIDKEWEIADKLTGVTGDHLTRLLRAQIEQNNGRQTLMRDGSVQPVRQETDPQGGANGDAFTPLGFGVVIPFYRHLDFLEDCLRSVADAAESLSKSALNVTIVNDDPKIGEALLESRIPNELRPFTRVLGNHGNLGISRTLNRGIMESSQPWVLLLDCDDKLDPACFRVLADAIRQKPDAAYLSSQMTLINDQDEFLGYYFRYRTVADQAENLAASHLKVFRRELFEEVGYHNAQFDGCQDYELALRIAIQKRIDLIPEFLYLYRWHTNNQGVSASNQQNFQRKKISQVYRLLVFALSSGKLPVTIEGDGPFRGSWTKHLPESSPSAFLSVNLPFASEWRLSAMIYFLADALGILYSSCLEGKKDSLNISLPSDYLSRLCFSCRDYLATDIPNSRNELHQASGSS